MSSHSPSTIQSPSPILRRGALSVLALALAAVLTLGLVACEPASGPERVTALRDTYEAQLNAFNVIETPMEVETEEPAEGEAEGEGDAAEGDEAEQPAEGDEGAEGEEGGDGTGDDIVEEVPMRQDVMLDILLRKTGGGGKLDGVTLDVYQVTADDEDKANYRIYVDTSRLSKGSRDQISHVIEDVDFVEGDKFAVAVRANVPPELYSEYKEYSDAGAGEEGSEG